MIDLAHYWTAIAEDLHTDEPGKQERTAAACLRFRKECAMFDYARALQWHDPQDVSVHADIPYLPDGGYRDGEVRGHLLDAYIPRDAIVRGGNTLPVYIDIHGGGFTYGYKELNRNFNTHLADLGFGVFSLNYRPARRPISSANCTTSRRRCAGSTSISHGSPSVQTTSSSPATRPVHV